MTLQEAKDQIAIQRGYESFNDFCRRQDFRLKIKIAYAVESLMDEAAELYARSKWDEACEAMREEIKNKYAWALGADEEYETITNTPKPEFKP